MIVSVRINTDKTNIDSVDEIINIFDVEGIRDKVNINLARVIAPTDACLEIEPTCLDVAEFAAKEVVFMKELKARGFTKHQQMSYPTIRLNHCCADNLSSFVIDYNGNMYKCYNDIGLAECAVGNICESFDAMDVLGKSSKYILNLPTKMEECKKCNLLPICMGGCPYNLSKGESCCSGVKYELDNILREKYKELVSNI